MPPPVAPRSPASAPRRAAVAAGPALVVLLVGVLAVGAIARTVRHTEHVSQASRVARTVDAIVLRILDGESAARGYVLTGHPRFLEPYHGASRAARRGLESLRLGSTDAAQRARIDESEVPERRQVDDRRSGTDRRDEADADRMHA